MPPAHISTTAKAATDTAAAVAAEAAARSAADTAEATARAAIDAGHTTYLNALAAQTHTWAVNYGTNLDAARPVGALLVDWIGSAGYPTGAVPGDRGYRTDTGEHWYASTSWDAWTPTDLGSILVGWYDFSDALTVTTDASGITQVADKSGNARTMAAAAAGNQPAYADAVQNGLSAADFDGTDDYLTSNALGALLADVTGNPKSLSIIAAVKPDLFTTTSRRVATLSSTTDDDTLVSVGFNTSSAVSVARRSNAAVTISATVAGATAAWCLADVTYSGAAITGHLNGTASTTATGAGDLTPTRATLGANGKLVPADFFDGQIGEVLWLRQGLPLAVRQRIEGYLAHKWGLTAILASDHPYKTDAPTTAPATGLIFQPDYSLVSNLDTISGSGWDSEQQPSVGGVVQNRVTVVEAVDLPGVQNGWKPTTRALRVELRNGDVWAGDGTSNRAEVYGLHAATGSTRAEFWTNPPMAVRWWGFSFYLPPDHVFDTTSLKWENISQIGKGELGGGPMFSIQFKNDDLKIGGAVADTGQVPAGGQVMSAATFPGRWTHVAVGAKLSPVSTEGWVEVWVDGVQRLARDYAATMEFVSGLYDPLYTKQGLYRLNSFTQTHIIYYSPMKVAYDQATVMVVD